MKLSLGFDVFGILEDLAAETEPPPLVGLFAVATDVFDGLSSLLFGLVEQT